MIYQTAHYQVKSEAVEKVKQAIIEFVEYIQTSEPTTLRYDAWQQADDPTKFCHLFIFQDEQAQDTHSKSDAVKKFEAIYSPELVGGPVLFTTYQLTATNSK